MELSGLIKTQVGVYIQNAERYYDFTASLENRLLQSETDITLQGIRYALGQKIEQPQLGNLLILLLRNFPYCFPA